MMYIFCLGIFASFLGGIVCPGPHRAAVSCFHCRGWGDVPTCLHTKHTCHHDEVCEVVWGTHDVTIGCRKEHDCQHDIHHASGTCAGGAYYTSRGCEKCCTDSSCVDGLATVLRKTIVTTITTAHPPVDCPNRCIGQMCSTFTHRCSSDEFCELRAERRMMTGRCVPSHELTRCNDEHAHNDFLCTMNNLYLIDGARKCLYCCKHTSCAMSHFRPTTHKPTTPTSTVKPTTTTTTTRRPTTASTTSTTKTTVQSTTTATTATTTVTTTQPPNPLLNGDCKNLLELNGCDPINTTVCSTDLGVRVCADSCGLCGLIKSRFTNNIICADHLISNECQVLQKTQDICNHNLAMFTCPKSCNICASVLDSLIKEVLTKTTTSMPTSATTAAMTTTQGSTSKTSPTISATTPATSTTPSAPPSSSKPVHIIHMTQVISQQPQVTNNTCVDTLQGMKCVDLQDICKNSIGPQICKKFCGLCGSTPVSTVPAVSSPSPSP